MAKFRRLSDEELMYIIQHAEEYSNYQVVCAMECLQYRMFYGDLGITHIHSDKFGKMVRIDANPVPENDDKTG